jgi:uncharacterized protein YecT (DUF1311 family)
MKSIYLSFAMSFPISTLAIPAISTLDIPALLDECDAYSMAGMRECLAGKVEDSLKVLQRAERNAADILSKWDDFKPVVIEAQKKFAISNKEFAKYRDKECEFMNSLGGSTNYREHLRLTCIAELNYRRADQLRTATSGMPAK